jgi:hypothetical protein
MIPCDDFLQLADGCTPPNSMQAAKSFVSPELRGFITPGEQPAPRLSTRTTTYPCGTHFSGSTTFHA